MNSVRAIALLLMLVVSSYSFGQDQGQAKSAAAKAALAKHETSVQKALAAYRAAMAEADKQLASDIDAALRRPAVAKDAEATSELQAAKRAAVQRQKEGRTNAADVEFPIVAATYGNLEKAVDVLDGVRQRLLNNQDIWVDKNLTDGRLQTDGELRIVFRSAAGKPVVLICRHGSRVFFTR